MLSNAGVQGGNMTRSIARVAVALILLAGSATAEDKNGWSSDVSASLSAQTGTTRTLSGTFDGKTTRAWEKDVASIRINATYGTSDDDTKAKETTQDNQALLLDWKHTIDDRFFMSTQSEVSRDSTQDRRLRFRVDSGPGYRVWQADDSGKDHFDVSTGLGYRYEVYDGNTNTANADTNMDQFVDAVLGFEYKNMLFDDKIEWTYTGGLNVPMNAVEAFIVRSEIIIGVPLTEAWSFRTSFLVEYTNEVPAKVTQARTNTTIGLGYKF